MTYDQWRTTDPNEPFADHEEEQMPMPTEPSAEIQSFSPEIDRIASIWEDVRTRLNVHKDYPELALAIENLVDSNKVFAGGGDGTFDENDEGPR